MQSSSRIMKIFFLLLLWLSGGCASDRPPTGGPLDTAPLQVVFSNPAPSATNISTEIIHLTFSHYISGRQLLNALHFSPSIGDYDIAVSGNDVDIKIHKPLKKNQTYVITLDKNLRDYRGRTFTGAYTLAFSTGAVIDTGIISGKVINQDFSSATNALLLAFSEHPNSSATENLLTREPDYLIQANASGAFSFNNIAPGSYRIIAVNDRNNDLRYNYKKEEIGLTNASVVSAGSTNLMLRLDGIYSNTNGLISCAPLEQQMLEIKFGHPINTTSFNPEKLEIRHAVTHTLIPVVTWFSKSRSLYEKEFIVVTDRLQPDQPYLVSYSSNEEKGKKPAISFYGSSRASGHRPLSITIMPENRSEPAYLDLAWPSLGKVVMINLSSPLPETALKEAITLSESATIARGNLNFSLIKIDPRTFALKPAKGFQPGRSYKVIVNPATIAGTTDKPDKAKPSLSQFRTAEKKEYGTISGKGHASAKYVVIEAKVSGTASTYSTTVLCDRNGTFHFTFPELPPGNYTLSAFIPSGIKPPLPFQQWDPGSIEPYKPAEPFGFYPEPVKVRTGWTTEQIDIQIIKSR